MPLPEPRDGEEHDEFITRCMGDDTMRQEFDDESQRRAVCERQWEDQSMDAVQDKHILRAIAETPWAMLPSAFAVLAQVAARHAAGEKLSAEEVAALKGKKAVGRVEGDVALLPLFGMIFPRANLMTEMSGATSAEQFGQVFRAAAADPSVGAIVLDVDSPGGAVHGVDELATVIREARAAKPVIAVANHLAASAAYWIASAASELVVTPTSEVGSIGVFAAHNDMSQALEMAGFKTTLISAGKYKVEGNQYEPLAEEARAFIQTRVDDFYAMFVKTVARNRGVSVAQARDGFGEGRVVGADQAVSLGMADRVDTLEHTVARLSGRTRPVRSAQAETELRQRRARMFEH